MNRSLVLPMALCAYLFASHSVIAQPVPTLILDASMQTTPGVLLALPLGFSNGGHAITAIALSIDLSASGFAFDATDADQDGVPDAVTLPAGTPAVTVVDYDPTDNDGELDILLANLSGVPLVEGVIVEVEVTPSQTGTAAHWVSFSDAPPPSFAAASGEDICGRVTVLGNGILFADGFESGNTCAWSAVSG